MNQKDFSFDTLIINLPTYERRWKHIENQLKRSDITRYKRVDGVLGKLAIEVPEVQGMLAPGVLEIVKSPMRESHDQHNPGSIGCYIAHMNAWKEFYLHSKRNYVLILEDDVWIDPEASRKAKKILQYARSFDWDMMLVGQRELWGPTKPLGKFEGFEFQKISEFTSMCGYFLKRTSIPKILEKAVPIKWQLDWFFGHMSKEIDCVAVSPWLVYLSQEANISGINHTPVGAFAIFKKAANVDRTQAFVLVVFLFAVIVLACRPSISHKKPCPMINYQKNQPMLNYE